MRTRGKHAKNISAAFAIAVAVTLSSVANAAYVEADVIGTFKQADQDNTYLYMPMVFTLAGDDFEVSLAPGGNVGIAAKLKHTIMLGVGLRFSDILEGTRVYMGAYRELPITDQVWVKAQGEVGLLDMDIIPYFKGGLSFNFPMNDNFFIKTFMDYSYAEYLRKTESESRIGLGVGYGTW